MYVCMYVCIIPKCYQNVTKCYQTVTKIIQSCYQRVTKISQPSQEPKVLPPLTFPVPPPPPLPKGFEWPVSPPAQGVAMSACENGASGNMHGTLRHDGQNGMGMRLHQEEPPKIAGVDFLEQTQ